MYSNAALRLYPRVPANTDFVDRGLNVAYERIRDIHNHLDDIEYVKDNITDISKLYEYFKEGIGDYDGITDSRFLGEVGVDDPSLKTVPPLIQLAHAVSDMKLLSAKVEDIYRVSSKIKHVIEVSYKLVQVEAVAENIQALLNIHKHIVELLALHDDLIKLISLSDNLETLLAIEKCIPQIDTVSKNINSVITLSDNIEKLNLLTTEINKLKRLYESVTNIDTLVKHIKNIDTISISNNIDSINNVSNSINSVNRLGQSITNIDRLNQSITAIDTLSPLASKLDILGTHIVGLDAIYNNLNHLMDITPKVEPVIGLSKLPDSNFALEKGVQYIVLDELESDEEKFSYWGSIKNLILDNYPGSKILPNNTTTIFMDGTESQVFPEDYTPVNPDTSIHINDPDYSNPSWSFNIIPDEDSNLLQPDNSSIHVNDPDYSDPDWAINIIPDVDDELENSSQG